MLTNPICIICSEEYNPRRKALGYSTCLDCGSPKKEFIMIPVPKSTPIVGTLNDLVGIASSHKGNR